MGLTTRRWPHSTRTELSECCSGRERRVKALCVCVCEDTLWKRPPHHLVNVVGRSGLHTTWSTLSDKAASTPLGQRRRTKRPPHHLVNVVGRRSLHTPGQRGRTKRPPHHLVNVVGRSGRHTTGQRCRTKRPPHHLVNVVGRQYTLSRIYPPAKVPNSRAFRLCGREGKAYILCGDTLSEQPLTTHTPLGQRGRTTVYFGLAFIIQPKYRTHVCTGPRETVTDFCCYKDTLLERSYTTSQRCGRQFTLSWLELILQPQKYALLYVMMMRIRMMTVVLQETASFRN